MKSHKTVDEYIQASKNWQPALNKLRQIALSSRLQETIKWGAPVYTFEGKNIIGLASFKSICWSVVFPGSTLIR